MSTLDILKTVTIALVFLVLGVTAFVHLRAFDPVFQFASIVALGVVSSLIYFYAVLKA